ncbi:cation:proton antiporter [Halomicrobium urmianum]|uniref:cation:proton antiporter n=1 Tax=Halomicrobium urmianum TaxID=1586233 RepID=UPI001CD9F3C5|nr:cation:proton antiporter [Halomicrobium urmianum]
MSAGVLIGAVVLIIGLGVAAQVIADRLSVPSVAFLLFAGVLVGPEGLELVSPDLFSTEALRAIVGLSVGIIVFEGSFHLSVDRVREAPRETLGLVTVGALVSLVGTAVAVRVALGADWDLAVLVGSLLIATGPTVITPIMNVVPVRERVAAALETEGIVNDVTAAVLAVATFEFVTSPGETPVVVLQAFGARLALGLAVGIGVGLTLAVLLRRVDLSTDNAPRNARLIVLVGALAAYALAETRLPEAGIAAAAVAGVTLGNADVPHEDVIAEFKGDVTLLVLSFVFVVLATLLSVSDLATLGLAGLAVVLAVVFLIRPLSVFLSTLGGRLSVRERIFVAAIGPRGIVPASVATLFAIELQNADQASILVGTVFLVIFVTVTFQGGLARHVAQALDVIPMHTIVVGGGRIGRELAARFESRGEEVVVVDSDEAAVERVRGEGHRAVLGDATDADTLEQAGAGNAAVVAAATADDDVNLVVAQFARSRYGVATVVVRANEPDNVAAFEDLDVETISASFAVADAMDDAIERPALAHWLADETRSGDVLEVELTAADADELTVQSLSADLPSGCLVVMVSRNGEDRVPDPDTGLRRGDHLTLVCQENEGMREAVERCRR